MKRPVLWMVGGALLTVVGIAGMVLLQLWRFERRLAGKRHIWER